MRETYQNILNVIIIIFILAAAILFYNQQKTMNQLSSVLKNQNIIAPAGQSEAAIADLVNQSQKSLTAKSHFIEGRLTSVSGNDLTVEADLPDWRKMKEAGGSLNPTPTYKKTYSVTVNGETKFFASKLDAIKVGDTIQVTAKELVYQTDKLTAVFIMSPSVLPAP